ncbi:MAG: membrane protein insertase YidC [Bacteroidales bacterium OttesenSCG-928-I14]|jgi:YidC/Oxa1 family membrane protein insertase|nr:membrane protein insertase YidC [Bacteroidales bacterium OttesenSCG-928-I14]
MNKNNTVGFILIFLVLFGYPYLNNYLTQKENTNHTIKMESLSNKTKNIYESTKQTNQKNGHDNFKNLTQHVTEKFTVIQNSLMEIKISNKGGYICSVKLKKYTNYKKEPLYLFKRNESVFNITFISDNGQVINSNNFYFEIITKSKLQAILRLNLGANRYIDFMYTMHPNDYMVDFSFNSSNIKTKLSPCMHLLNIQWAQKIRQQEKCRKFEERYARLTYRFLAGDVKQLCETKDDIKTISNRLQWIGYKDQFFSSVFITQNNFESTKLYSKYLVDKQYIKEYNTSTDVSYNDLKQLKFNFYFGPNDYTLLKNYDKTKLKNQNFELEKLVPLGWNLFRSINKYLIIPLFDWLTSKLKITLGLAIFLLTLIIKFALFPLTYKSFISSAKIRVLRPQIETINSKYQGRENALTRQQKTMELYRQVGVNPMTGCLPMLLQMPFLIALFTFFPSSISLRHHFFLWADDLSTYDSIIHWNNNIYFISKFLDNHISLFCLLMSLATILNTKYTMYQQNTEQEQFSNSKWLMYLMPIVMFFFLNSYPAGLNYYYLISTLITIAQTIIFRILVDETKLLNKLEENKKKIKLVKNKPNFITRLEKMQQRRQKLMQQQLRRKNR